MGHSPLLALWLACLGPPVNQVALALPPPAPASEAGEATAAGPNAAPRIDFAKMERVLEQEPAYDLAPRYCLLVFGQEASTRIWLAVVGRQLYIDRNGNGDLTEPGERIGPVNVFDRSSFRKAVNVDRLFRVNVLQEVNGTTTHHNFRLTVYDDERFRCSIQLANGCQQSVGSRTLATLPRLASRPQDAPIIHFNGPLTFAARDPIVLVARTGKSSANRILRFWLGSPGDGPGTFAYYASKPLLDDQWIAVSSKFPAGPAGRITEWMKQHQAGCCWSYGYLGKLEAPLECGSGAVRLTLSMPQRPFGEVTPGRIDGFIVGGSQDVPTLQAALQSDSAVVRRKVMSALRSRQHSGGAEDRDAPERVRQALVAQAGSTDRSERRGAILGLAEFQAASVATVLTRAMGDRVAEIRAAAIHSLRGQDKLEQFETSLLAALGDSASVVRQAAAETLSVRAPSANAVRVALAHALQDSDPSVRAAACNSLGAAGADARPQLSQWRYAVE